MKHKTNVAAVAVGFILYFWSMWQLDILMKDAWRLGAWTESHALWYYWITTKGWAYDMLTVFTFIGLFFIFIGLWFWENGQVLPIRESFETKCRNNSGNSVSMTQNSGNSVSMTQTCQFTASNQTVEWMKMSISTWQNTTHMFMPQTPLLNE